MRKLGAHGRRVLLGRVVVIPRPPLQPVRAQRLAQLRKGGDRAREREAVEPHRVGDPLVRLLLLRVEVERAAGGEQDLHGGGREVAVDELDLHREHQRPDLLVPLEEAALHVASHVEGHVLDDVDDALRRQRRGRRALDRLVEERQELLQRDLVHRVDGRHVDDDKVEQRAARRHGAVLLTRGRDARVGLLRRLQLRLHLDGGLLRQLQHLHQAGVVEQVARRVGEPIEQIVLEPLERALVGVTLLDELLLLLLELGPLELHRAAEQLLLQPALVGTEREWGGEGRERGR